MEAWRQWPLGGKKQTLFNEKRNNPLDSDRPSHGRPLHSEPRSGILSAMEILRQLSNARRLFSIFETIWGGEWQDQ